MGLIDEEIIEEDEEFEREASMVDQLPSMHKKQSSMVREAEIQAENVRKRYKIDSMDVENVEAA